MKKCDNHILNLDTYLPEYDTEYGYLLTNEVALERYIEKKLCEYREEWLTYIKEQGR